MPSHAKNINSTNPITIVKHGSIHIGAYPSGFSLNYISVVFSEKSDGSVCLGISLNSDKNISYSSHIFIQNSTNTGGIISTWRGNYYISNLILNDCSGKLFRIVESCSITIMNSQFCEEIDINNANIEGCYIISEEVKISPLICGDQQLTLGNCFYSRSNILNIFTYILLMVHNDTE